METFSREKIWFVPRCRHNGTSEWWHGGLIVVAYTAKEATRLAKAAGPGEWFGAPEMLWDPAGPYCLSKVIYDDDDR
jgi:hypothetical protein